MRHCDLCGTEEHCGDRSTALALCQLRSGDMLFICEKCLSEITRPAKASAEEAEEQRKAKIKAKERAIYGFL